MAIIVVPAERASAGAPYARWTGLGYRVTATFALAALVASAPCAAARAASTAGVLVRPPGWHDVSTADSRRLGAVVYAAPQKIDGFRQNIVVLRNRNSIGALLARPAARLVDPGQVVTHDRRPLCRGGYEAREITLESVDTSHGRHQLISIDLAYGMPSSTTSEVLTYTRPVGTAADPEVAAAFAHVCGY